MTSTADTRYFLLQKHPQKEVFVRHFPPLDDNILIKVLLGSVLEECIVERKEHDLDYLLNYILVLRSKLKDKKHHELEAVATDVFQKY